MYKLLIFIFFPFFVFSDDLNLKTLCSSPDQDSVTEKLEGILCKSRWAGGLFTFNDIDQECSNTLRNDYEDLRQRGWTQKQINYIAYYLSRDIQPNQTMPYIANGSSMVSVFFQKNPPTQAQLYHSMNSLRRSRGLPELLNISSMLSVTPGCENLFLTKHQVFNSLLTCNPKQKLITRKLLARMCYVSKSCKETFEQNQRILIENGWTQQQINYISYYVYIKPKKQGYHRAFHTPHTEYIVEQNISPPYKEELPEFITEIRTHYEIPGTLPKLTPGTSDCEFPFPSRSDESITVPFPSSSDESITESGTGCIDCRLLHNSSRTNLTPLKNILNEKW